MDLPTLPAVPGWVKSVTIALVTASLIPLALIARARVSTSTSPRIHIVHDMDHQEKFRPQEENELFADGRAMRLPVAGTVARGELQHDDELYRGTVAGSDNATWVTSIPSSLTVNQEFLARGKERYAIHCAPCHGLAGYGDGLVHQRAVQLTNQGKPGIAWQAPKNLHTDKDLNVNTASKKPAGYVYHVITHGYNNMNGYKSQIKVTDRWAIVAYIAALQRSQGGPQ